MTIFSPSLLTSLRLAKLTKVSEFLPLLVSGNTTWKSPGTLQAGYGNAMIKNLIF